MSRKRKSTELARMNGMDNLWKAGNLCWRLPGSQKPLLPQQNLEARVGIEPTMQLLQSRALPLGYPATGTMRLILFRTRIKFSFATNHSLIAKPKFTPPLPKFLRFENSNRRDDAGDQFRRRHIETRIARTARRIRHADVSAPDKFRISDFGFQV